MYAAAVTDEDGLRIGEFARRVEVSADLLRAWERRYGLLRPRRSAGGFRVYDRSDAERVARMRTGLAAGLSAAEAAAAALANGSPERAPLEGLASRLFDSFLSFDEPGANTVLDEAFAGFALDAVLSGVILPVLVRIGDGWEAGTIEVSQEHLASNVIRARLLSLARLWGRGAGPLAVLACAPGERHDIGLLALGLVLRSYGVRILYLGADTPIDAVRRMSQETSPAFVVVTSHDASLLDARRDELRQLASTSRLVLGGPGVTLELCELVGARFVTGDVVSAAAELARAA